MLGFYLVISFIITYQYVPETLDRLKAKEADKNQQVAMKPLLKDDALDSGNNKSDDENNDENELDEAKFDNSVSITLDPLDSEKAIIPIETDDELESSGKYNFDKKLLRQQHTKRQIMEDVETEGNDSDEEEDSVVRFENNFLDTNEWTVKQRIPLVAKVHFIFSTKLVFFFFC